MSDVTITLPPPSVPKPHPPPSAAKSHSVSSIPKPLPPSIVTASSKGTKEKVRVQRSRYKFSPPTLPPPAPPTITASPPPYSSISHPPSPPSPASPLALPAIVHQRTPPPRPPPPSSVPPSAPPRPPTPDAPSAPPRPPTPDAPSAPPRPHTPDAPSAPLRPHTLDAPSAPPRPPTPDPPSASHQPLTTDQPPEHEDDEVMMNDEVNRSNEDMVKGGGEGGNEIHYERTPISEGAAGITIESDNENSGPDYANINSLDEGEEEDEMEGEDYQEPKRISVVRQDYQNWDFLGVSDSEDEDNNITPQPTTHRHHHHPPTQSNPPTLPLNTHPVLMAKISGGLKKKGVRRNRAPPPPPGKDGGSKGVGGVGGRINQNGKKKKRESGIERETEREVETEELAEGEEHDYSTIPRTNYINWEFEDRSESDENDSNSSATPKPKTAHKPSNPPTLPLNTHPVLMRSHSHDNVLETIDDVDGKRPKNRAPPPPPTKSKNKPPRGFVHQLSQPHTITTQSGGNESTTVGVQLGREGGEYGRVSKPPPAHKRTKSDQHVVSRDKQKQQQQSPADKQQQTSKDKQQQHTPKDKQQDSKKPLKSTQSPLTTHKSGEATPPLDHHRGKNAAAERVVVKGGGGGGGRLVDGPPGRPPPRAPAAAAGRKRWSAIEFDVEGRGKERETQLQANNNMKRKESSGGADYPMMRPKRQAPPPPVIRGVSIDQGDRLEEQSCREPPQGAETPASLEKQTNDTKTENRLQTPPPKPKRLHRRSPPSSTDAITMATEATPTAQESTETEEERQTSESPRAENGQGLDTRWERLLHKMEFFTIDLIKEGDRSLGMVIVSGKVRNKDGSTVEGIFIQKILPGSLTDKDGRIQAGDMLVEINTTPMVGATVEQASKKLRDSKDSVKLKVGRPDRGAFKVPGQEIMEPIYVNSDEMEDSDLQMKLDKAEAKAAMMEEMKEKAESELKIIREMADKEQKNFHKKLQETEEGQENYRKDTQSKITDLTIALANITIDKTKLEKEVESLKSSQMLSQSSNQDVEITQLKRELKEAESERDMAERDLQQLRQEMEGDAGLQSRLSELDSTLAHVQQERDTVRRQLESTCHELTVAHVTLEQMQIEKTTLNEENEQLSRELERERKPSTGRVGVETELTQKRKDLSAAERELQTLQEVRNKIQREAEEMRKELEKERGRNSELEKKLESQQNTEKTAVANLLRQLETQAKQIHDLKDELSKAKSSSSAIVVTAKEEQQQQGGKLERERERSNSDMDKKTEKNIGPMSVDIVLDDSSPEHKTTQSPERPRASSGNKISTEKVSPARGKEKSASPKPLKDKPYEESISVEDFDRIKPLPMLDNTHAKDKSQVALRIAKRARNKPSRDHIRSMSAENLLKDLDGFSPDPEPSPTELAPVPRPRKPTMEKDKESPQHKPLPIPRNIRSPVPTPNEPPQRPPKLDSERGQGSPERKVKFGRLSPPLTRAPSPRPLLPPSSAAKSGLPPRPVPRRVNKRSEDIPPDESQTKDPSQLTIKEKMELAQKMARRAPPPVLPKRPPTNRSQADSDQKSLSQPESDEGDLQVPRHSYDNGQSPRPIKKLPPGAFNIGLMPMTPFAQSRQRSNTVGISSREHSMERETAEQYSEQIQKEEDKDVSSSREELDTDDIEIKFPPKRPPLPLTKRSASNEKPAQLSSRNNDLLTEATPPSVAADSPEGNEEETDDGGGGGVVDEEHGTLPDPSSLDYTQVLTWSPTQVASWLTRIGASQHAKVFLDRGVQGNKLFDMDGSGLKAMGVISTEDRMLIKREIKALRPYADKQKKLLEKQRKDDKKKKKKLYV